MGHPLTLFLHPLLLLVELVPLIPSFSLTGYWLGIEHFFLITSSRKQFSFQAKPKACPKPRGLCLLWEGFEVSTVEGTPVDLSATQPESARAKATGSCMTDYATVPQLPPLLYLHLFVQI